MYINCLGTSFCLKKRKGKVKGRPVLAHKWLVTCVRLSLLIPPAVSMDGKNIEMSKGKSEAEHILGLSDGELRILWQLHRAELGNSVEIITGELDLPEN